MHELLWGQFWEGLGSSFLLIFFNSIGDKTFIMVTTLTTQVNKFILYLVACSAMVFMHVLSVVLGTFFAYLIPKWIIEILVIILFTLFGLFFIFKAFRAPNKRKEKKPENSHDQA